MLGMWCTLDVKARRPHQQGSQRLGDSEGNVRSEAEGMHVAVQCMLLKICTVKDLSCIVLEPHCKQL